MNKRISMKIIRSLAEPEYGERYTPEQHRKARLRESKALRKLSRFIGWGRTIQESAQKAADRLHNVAEVVKLIARNRVRNMEGIIKVEYERS